MHPATETGKYERLLARCQNLAPVPTAVAHPREATALAGAVQAAKQRLIVPLLVGPAARIAETAEVLGARVPVAITSRVRNALAGREDSADATASESRMWLCEQTLRQAKACRTQRADSVRSKIVSCAVAKLVAHARRQTV